MCLLHGSCICAILLPTCLLRRSPEREVSPEIKANQVVWKGFVNMSGLAKFATTAYAVSGPAESLHEVKGG